MNREVLETNWSQVREILRDKFSDLTEEDIRQINGRYDQLVAKLQQKYGYTREEAEERIRSWNFDRSAPRGQVIRDERMRMREENVRKEEDSSSIFKWLLGLGIPLLLLGAYFLSTDRTDEMNRTTTTPANTQQQVVIESPADRAISNSIRNAFLSQQVTAAELQNVQIATNNGIVTLNGFVSSPEMKDFLGTTARNFAGVRQVNNNLQVR